MSQQTPIPLAPRVERIHASPTSTMNKHLRALRDGGRDIVGLNIGEPDFATPEHVRRAAIAAIEAGDTDIPRRRTPALRRRSGQAATENGLLYDARRSRLHRREAGDFRRSSHVAQATSLIPAPCGCPTRHRVAGGARRAGASGPAFRRRSMPARGRQ